MCLFDRIVLTLLRFPFKIYGIKVLQWFKFDLLHRQFWSHFESACAIWLFCYALRLFLTFHGQPNKIYRNSVCNRFFASLPHRLESKSGLATIVRSLIRRIFVVVLVLVIVSLLRSCVTIFCSHLTTSNVHNAHSMFVRRTTARHLTTKRSRME